MKKDIYLEVSNQIAAMMEANPGQWLKPWKASGALPANTFGLPCNGVTGKAYRGVNIVLLWSAGEAKGYGSNQWASFNQWKAKGGIVRKGERGTLIVFYKKLTVEDRAKPGTDATKVIPLLRCYHVFNRAQVDGLAEVVATPAPVKTAEEITIERHAAAEAFIAATGASIMHGGNRAFYSPAYDRIMVPHAKDFHGTPTSPAMECYYTTVLHEIGHWTGHETRCNRDFSGRFGNAAYAAEELVAELTAAFLAAELGISAETRPDHAQYLASWVKLIKDDSKAIFTAAAKASAACDFLHGLQAAEDEAAEEDEAAMAA